MQRDYSSNGLSAPTPFLFRHRPPSIASMLAFQPTRSLRLCVHLVAKLTTRPTTGRGGERLRAAMLLDLPSYRRQFGYSALAVPGNQAGIIVATPSNPRVGFNNRRWLSSMSSKAYVQPVVDSTSIFKDDLFTGKVLFCTGGGSGICKEMTRSVVNTHTTHIRCTCPNGS